MTLIYEPVIIFYWNRDLKLRQPRCLPLMGIEYMYVSLMSSTEGKITLTSQY